MNTKDNFKLWEEVGLFRYGPARGTILFTPRSTKIWEIIQKYFDSKFAALGVENVLLPALMPLDLFKKEKDNFAGFSPELITITKIGEKELDKKEHLILRPTSEPLFSLYFRDLLNSYRDLPIKLNQWTNVWRWEKATNPFLRTKEFHWQEGHAIFQNRIDMQNFLSKIKDVYLNFFLKKANLFFFRGEKPISERFPGALRTITQEAILPDGQFLQLATIHDLGEEFSKIYDVRYRDKNNKEKIPVQCSWGASTRIIAAILMNNSDENGIALPFPVADVQIELVGLWTDRPKEDKEIFDFLKEVNQKLKDVARKLKEEDKEEEEEYRTGIEVPLNRDYLEKKSPIKYDDNVYDPTELNLKNINSLIRFAASNKKTWSRRINEIFRRGTPLVIFVGSDELKERKIAIYSRKDWFSSPNPSKVNIIFNSKNVEELTKEIKKKKEALEEWFISKNSKKGEDSIPYKSRELEKAKKAIEKRPWHVFVYVCGDAKCEIKSGKLLGASPRVIKEEKAPHFCFSCETITKKTICYGRAY